MKPNFSEIHQNVMQLWVQIFDYIELIHSMQLWIGYALHPVILAGCWAYIFYSQPDVELEWGLLLFLLQSSDLVVRYRIDRAKFISRKK